MLKRGVYFMYVALIIRVYYQRCKQNRE